MADEPTIAEEILHAVVAQLIRKGALTDEDIDAIGADLDAKAEDASGTERERLKEASHQFSCTVIEANAPTKADWAAAHARKRFRVIKGDAEQH